MRGAQQRIRLGDRDLDLDRQPGDQDWDQDPGTGDPGLFSAVEGVKRSKKKYANFFRVSGLLERERKKKTSNTPRMCTQIFRKEPLRGEKLKDKNKRTSINENGGKYGWGWRDFAFSFRYATLDMT